MDRRLFLVVALLAVIGFVVVPAVASAAELTGKVVSADAAKNTMVVNADGKDTTVTWTDSTKFTGGKEEDLKKDTMVKVTHEGGKASAIEIVAAKKK